MPAPSPVPRSAARARILSVAGLLFYEHGIRAVGVDTIIKEADVAKMTFYKHFASKDQLVIEYLRTRDRQWWSWIDAALKNYAADDPRKPLVVFDALEQRLRRPFKRGCAFVNAMTDLADASHPAYQVALRHKEQVELFLHDLCQELDYEHPDELTQQLILLLEGALVRAQRAGIAGPAKTAKELGRKILAASPRSVRPAESSSRALPSRARKPEEGAEPGHRGAQPL